jgi:hypothetical protein
MVKVRIRGNVLQYLSVGGRWVTVVDLWDMSIIEENYWRSIAAK